MKSALVESPKTIDKVMKGNIMGSKANSVKFLLLIVLLGSAISSKGEIASSPDAIISVKPVGFSAPGNTLRLIVMRAYIFGSYERNEHTAITATAINGIFTFKINALDELSYFVIQMPNDSNSNAEVSYLGDPGYIEPGDSILMEIVKTGNTLMPGMAYYRNYYGIGALKLTCLENLRTSALFQSGNGRLLDSMYNPSPLYFLDLKNNVMSAILQNYRGKISDASYDQLTTDIAYIYEGLRMDELRRHWVKARQDWQKDKIKNYLDSLLARPLAGSDLGRSKSKYYAGAFLRQSIIQNLTRDIRFSYNLVYSDIKNLSPLVRDRVLMELFATYGPVLSKRDSLLAEARKVVNNPLYLTYLEKFSKAQEGRPALDYALTNTTGQTVKLSDFAGKVLFMDFWFTGCGPCALYYKNQLQAVHHYFAGNPNVIFMSISVDASKEKWLKSIQSHQYTDPSLVNLFTNGEGQKHDIIQTYNVIGFPSPVLIDQSGRIAALQRGKLMTKEKLIEQIEDLLKPSQKPSNGKPAAR